MAVIPEPEWLSSFNAKRKPGFQPGQSGNPAGRAKGSKNKKTLLREELERDGSELAQLIKNKAREGDTSCMAMWLARLDPPLRAAAQRAEFDLDPDAPVSDQARQVIVAVSRGQLDLDSARVLLDMLSAFVGLKDVETFLDELKRLKSAKSQHIPGGVLTT